MPTLNNYIVRFIFSCVLALIISSYIINFEENRLSASRSKASIKNNAMAISNIEGYFSNIITVLDQIENKYTGECDNRIILFMRRELFSILGGVEFGIVSRYDKKSYVICNSWGDGENVKVRNPINSPGYLMTGPHKINSLGEPVYVVKKTHNDIEYNLILKISSLSGIVGTSNISLIKSGKHLYGTEDYTNTEKSNVISNIEYGLGSGEQASLPLYYKIFVFTFVLAVVFFSIGKKLIYMINRYLLVRKINSGGYFFNVFQPIVDAKTNSVFSYEVFTRAPSHTNALSIMNEIKRFNIHDEHAINQIEQVKQSKLDNVIQINISVKNMLSDRFYSYVSSLDEGFIKGTIFEITEDENLLENKDIVSERMKALKELGYRFAIDDYGVGYSNLAYLVELNFDYIKIDKSMTRNDNRNLLSIIKALVSDMGTTCIAEGVESRSQADMLNEIGIDIQQGWYYGKPVELCDI
ncbi:EAL domain-containing protein [Vibrio sp. WJH972]